MQLTRDLKQYNPLEYFNNDIQQYIEQCINGISNGDVDMIMKSDAAVQHMQKIEKYRTITKLYLIKHDFCRFWNTFLDLSSNNTSNSRKKKIVESIWLLLKKLSGYSDTDSLVDVIGILDVFQRFSQKLVFPFGDECKSTIDSLSNYNQNSNQKTQAQLGLEWLEQWNHFWKMDNTKQQFESICRLMKHFFIGPLHRKMVHDDSKNLFDHVTFSHMIIECIRWIRDGSDGKIDESEKNNNIALAVNVKFWLFFCPLFFFCVWIQNSYKQKQK